ncbi:MAG: hypothetical protein AB1733_17980 [Thermodesulfobacteriota bacterium]
MRKKSTSFMEILPAKACADGIIPRMLWIIAREFVVFLVCLAVFPTVVGLLLLYSDSYEVGMSYLRRQLASSEWSPEGGALSLWFKLLVPYAVVQAVRAFSWAQRSVRGRRWANLYFTLLLAILGFRSSYLAWDLFYFMYAMGDMPSELLQFIEMEGLNVAVAFVSFLLAGYCLRICLNPHIGHSDSNGRQEG